MVVPDKAASDRVSLSSHGSEDMSEMSPVPTAAMISGLRGLEDELATLPSREC